MRINIPKVALVLLIVPLLLGMTLAFASNGADVIRVYPPYPTTVSTPAEFEVYTTSDQHTAYSPYIFLAMTKESYDAWASGVVKVEWDGGYIEFEKSDFQPASGGWLPPSLGNDGYQADSVRDHLGASFPIYWAFGGPILDDPITTVHQKMVVTLPSAKPKMLVYVLGKSDPSGDFNMKTPNSIPGFLVPEPATLIALGASATGLAAYAVKKRKN